MAQVRTLAERARVPFGLTGRELAMLRLLAAGRTNAQIGAELYISPRTASAHVTSIFRQLGVSSRVQAAQVERARLLAGQQPKDARRKSKDLPARTRRDHPIRASRSSCILEGKT